MRLALGCLAVGAGLALAMDMSAASEADMNFDAVTAGDHTPNACTPQIEPDFVGIRIHAPEKVRVGEAPFLICGTFRFGAEYVNGFPDVLEALVFVAVDARHHAPYTGTLAPDAPLPELEDLPPVEEPDWMENHTIQGYFNVDLFTVLEGLPEAPGTYDVYVLLETHKSNVVKVTLAE